MSSKFIGNIANMMKQFFYTKTETDTKLAEKSNTDHTHVNPSLAHDPQYNSSYVASGTSYFARRGEVCTYIFSFNGQGGAFTQAGTWYTVSTENIPETFRPISVGVMLMCPPVATGYAGGIVKVMRDRTVQIRLDTAKKQFQLHGTLTYVCNGDVGGGKLNSVNE